MGNCIYCSQNAGWFRKTHKECRLKNAQVVEDIVSLAAQTAQNGADLPAIEGRIGQMAQAGHVAAPQLRQALNKGLNLAVGRCLEDCLISEEEEVHLKAFTDKFSITHQENPDGFIKIIKGATLSDVLQGKLNPRLQFNEPLPFNFQKGEVMIWVFPKAVLLEEKTKTQYVGSCGSISVRICKGVYYHTSSFRGHPVQTSYMQQIDTGIMAFTQKHIYFGGRSKSFRIPLEKVVAFVPFDDGIGIDRDGTSAKRQVFKIGDGWFTYNLVKNLALLHAGQLSQPSQAA